jgi:hypothetical protein
MIRALLDGRKTQTRRVLKPWPGDQAKWLNMETLHASPTCYLAEVDGNLGVQMQHPLAGTVQPYGEVDPMSPLTWVRLKYTYGDLLWVRETIRREETDQGVGYPVYAADNSRVRFAGKWFRQRHVIPSIHMPRWASRLTLVVTDVRVQRVQDISSSDVLAEGVEPNHRELRSIPRSAGEIRKRDMYHAAHTGPFSDLWDSINAKRGFGWDANPWVVALTFDVHKCNIDQMK